MSPYSSLTVDRLVPSLLKPLYGETTTYAALLIVHGGTVVITILAGWVFWAAPILQTPEMGQVAMWLLWDLAGGCLAHLMPANHRYWARLPTEIRLLALASMAWQPLVLVLVFNQPMLLLVELHLFAGFAYWLLTRLPVALVLPVGLVAGGLLTYQLTLAAPIAVLVLIYCLKAILAYRPELAAPVAEVRVDSVDQSL